MDLSTLLFVCPLFFLAGLVDGIGGGGGLISLPTYLLAGLPPHLAIGTSKLVFADLPIGRPSAASCDRNQQTCQLHGKGRVDL